MAQTKVNKTVARIFAELHRLVYRASGGRIGGSIQGGKIVVLTTTGRRSGKQRERPLIALDHPEGWVVIASFSGHDEHPAWYLNLQSDPAATVRDGSEVHDVVARVAEGDERTKLWDELVAVYSDYEEYQAVTDRKIPIVVLQRQPA